MVSPQVTNVAIILIMMQAAKKVPFENPDVLMGVRGLYILSNVLIVSLYLYVNMQINKKNDMTTLKYVEPAPPLSGEEPKLVTTTIAQYDQSQLRSLWKSWLMGIAMVSFMHLYMKYTNPLLIQSILPFKGALEANLVKVHVWGQPAAGDLKRPWKAAGMMGAAGGEIKSDKKSIDEAEKKSRGGAKEE